MSIKVKKNFVLDKDLIEATQKILEKRNQNFVEIITLYLQAINKDEHILDEVQKIAKKRKGAFIGMLDNQIGDVDYKTLKREYYENFS